MTSFAFAGNGSAKLAGGWSSFEMVLRYAYLAGEHLKGATGHVEGTLRAQPLERVPLRLVVSH